MTQIWRYRDERWPKGRWQYEEHHPGLESSAMVTVEGPFSLVGEPSEPRDIVERLTDEHTDDVWDLTRCTLCGREPCCCGVPKLYREEVDALRAEAAAEIRRLREERDQYDEAFNDAMLRTQEGERVEGWVISEEAQGPGQGTIMRFETGPVRSWPDAVRATLILHPPEEPKS